MEKAVFTWYCMHGRDLPWRHTIDPYAILVAEIMLQQTQVDRVVPKYLSFLAQFPTMDALARTPRADVIKEWSGLGYNRRAVHLHEFAKAIRNKGAWPATPDDLARLPGIGPYTSRSMLVFSNNADETLIEANIRRIYLRLFIGRPLENPLPQIEALAKKHLPSGKSRDWHNALMDFGSIVCTAKNPSCEVCPLAPICISKSTLTKDEIQEIASTTFRTAQSKFKGSNRWYRSAILKLVQKEGTVSLSVLGKKIKNGYSATERGWLAGIVDGLVRDGLVIQEGKRLRLA